MSTPIAPDLSRLFMELGAAFVGLAALARLANRGGFSAIPLFLLAGLALGNGGLIPLRVSEGFIHVGAEMGVVLLLFMLGLEYSGQQLKTNLRIGLPSGLMDFVLNFPPGFIAALLLGWGTLGALALGGVTWVSSSGIIARVLAELRRTDAPETPAVLSVLVLEDLSMAVFLPVLTVALAGRGFLAGLLSVTVAIGAVGIALWVAVRHGKAVSRAVAHGSDEVLLLSTFGLLLLVAGAAQRLQVSAAVGAFLLGIALTGTVAGRAQRLLAPLRDLFAAVFFFFFGLQIDPATLPPVLLSAAGLAVVSALTKVATGFWAARRAGVDTPGAWCAGATLTARGEFSIVIAGLAVGAGLPERLGALSAAYVLLLAVVGPLLARAAGGRHNK